MIANKSTALIGKIPGAGGGGGGGVESVSSGSEISVNNIDPANPIVNASAALQDAASKRHSQNTDLYLDTQASAKIYVDKNRNDTYTPTGTITKPFKTIQEAINYIAAQALVRSIIKVAPGVYTENLTINNDNYIFVDLESAHIIGDVTWNISASVASFQAKLIFRGHDGRGYYPTSAAYHLNCIQGNVTIAQASGVSRYIGLHILNTGIVGNITLTGNGYLSHLFFINGGYTGDIISNETNQAVVYADNSHFSGSASIGGAQGRVNPANLANVELTRPWVIGAPIGGGGGDCRNVIFKTGSIFTGFTGTLKLDPYSYASYLANVVAGSEIVTLMDGSSIYKRTTNSRIIYVSKTGSNTTGNGSQAKPYLTIQKALDAIPVATDSASMRQTYIIKIEPGTYDEDLTVDIGRKKIILYSEGSVNLGTFNSSNWAPSGATRNINITCSLASIDSIRTSFSIISGTLSNAYGTHQAYSHNFRISGTINISNSTGGTSGELFLKGVLIFGWDGAVAGNNASIAAGSWQGNLNCYFDVCRFYGVISGGVARVQVANQTSFDKLITIATYSQIKFSEVKAGMTWAIAPTETQPAGIYNSSLTGTFTGAASVNLLIDESTNYYFTVNGAILAAGEKIVMGFSTSEAKGTYSYLDAGGEQTVYELVTTLRKTINSIWLDLINITQNGTIKIYSKIDGTNYREVEAYPFSVATDSDGVLINLNMCISDSFKITYTEETDEGASKNIPYLVTWENVE